ncbi:MAG: SRPBCC family protein [Chloroflexota bacterium]
MISINRSTTIYRPIKQVFDFMSTPENDFQWQYGILESSVLAEGANNIGTFFQSIGHLMGRRSLSTFEVTEYEPNKKFSFKSLSGPLQSVTCYTFEIARGSTQVNISIQANVVNFLQMNEAILKKTMGKQLKENLAMLKSILETIQLPPVSGMASSANN